MTDHRAEFMRLWTRNATIPQVASLYGLTANEMGLALHYARLSKVISNAARKPLTVAPPAPFSQPTDKVWCGQCDSLVPRASVAACASPWCKAKEAKAA